MVGLHDGEKLRKYYAFPRIDYVVEIHSNRSWDLKVYLIPVFCLCGIFFVGLLCMFVFRWYELRRRRRLCCLTSRQLWRLPQTKYSKGQNGTDTCAICLEDYENGDLLRTLPCDHAYHTKCIDPWLLKNRRVCPICKRTVFPQKPRSRSIFRCFCCNRVTTVDVNDDSGDRLMDEESDTYEANTEYQQQQPVDGDVTHYGAIASSVVRRPRVSVDPAGECTPLLNGAPVFRNTLSKLPIRVRHSAPCFLNQDYDLLPSRSYTFLTNYGAKITDSVHIGLPHSKAGSVPSPSGSLPCCSSHISSRSSQSTTVSSHHSAPHSSATRPTADGSTAGEVRVDRVRAIVHCSQSSNLDRV
ncbi:unnamed protein product [Dicrocoelium dendriticum]|nr:unnamed protein product [Dicrocoelium dendriticum]